MSSLASFHLLPAWVVAQLLVAAVPQRVEEPGKGLLFWRTTIRREDALPAFLEAHAQLGFDFERSGHAFGALEIMLEARGGPALLAGSFAEECERVSAARGESFVLYDEAAARSLNAALEATAPTHADAEAFLRSEYGESDPEDVEALVAAHRTIRDWLSRVTTSKVGLLRLG